MREIKIDAAQASGSEHWTPGDDDRTPARSGSTGSRPAACRCRTPPHGGELQQELQQELQLRTLEAAGYGLARRGPGRLARSPAWWE